MRKLIALLAVGAAACGGSQAPLEQRSREAMPTADGVAIATPNQSAASKDPGGTSAPIREPGAGMDQSTVGDNSSSFAVTAGLALTVNGGTAGILGLIKGITDLPPTSCADKTCVWGPGSNALEKNDWRLTVSYDESKDEYSYALDGRSKANPAAGFKTVVSGTAVPSGIPHRGTGGFLVDFDASHALNPDNTDQGKLTVTYDNRFFGKTKVDATFLGVRDNNHVGQTLNIGYSYVEDGSGGGDLDVAFRSNQTPTNTLSLHSRWKATGAGRGDWKVVAGQNGATLTGTASECWDKASAGFKVVFYVDPGATSGSESACAFSPAQPSEKQAP